MSVRIPDYFKVNDKTAEAKGFNHISEMQLKAKSGIRVGDI
jgi:hypothetical protein